MAERAKPPLTTVRQPRLLRRWVVVSVCITVSVVCLMGGCPPGAGRASAAEYAPVWGVRGGDAGHSGRMAADGPAEGDAAWQLPVYRVARSNPVIDGDGRIYVADNSGAACFSPDGDELWQTAVGWCLNGGLALGPGPGGDLQLYFGTHDPWAFWCLGATDGRIRWRVLLPAPADGPPAIDAQGKVWFGCDDGLLRCYTPQGTACGSVALASPVRAAPAFSAGGAMYAAGFGGRIIALSPDGITSWERDFGCTISSSPVVADGRLYLGDDLGRAWCFDLDGEVLFCAGLQGALGQPAVDAACGSYFASAAGILYALTPQGDVAWTFRSSGPIRSHVGPVVDPSGRVYFGAADAYLRALAPDGSLIWQLALGGEPGTLAAAADGAILTGTGQGRIVRTSSGSPAGSSPEPGPTWPPPVDIPEPSGLDGWHIVQPEITVDPFAGLAWPEGTCLCWACGSPETECGRACGGPAVIVPEREGRFDLYLWLESGGELTFGPTALELKVDTSPPSVEVCHPPDGGLVEAGSPFVPSVDATDQASGVASLALLLDDEELDPDFRPAPGPHVFTVVCTDNAGLVTEVSVEFVVREDACSAQALSPVLVGRRGNGCGNGNGHGNGNGCGNGNGQGNGAVREHWVTVLVRVPAEIASQGPPECVFLSGVPGTPVARLPAQSAGGQRLFVLRFDRGEVESAIARADRDPVGAGGRVFQITLDLSWFCGQVPCATTVSFMYIP